jgi:hypothetical protein
MERDELDRLLSDEEIIRPSAGFAEAVMGEIYGEAQTPRTIAFPWRPVLAGLASATLGLGAAVGAAFTTPAADAAAQWAQIADWIARGAKGLAATGASETAASLALALTFMLVPVAVYEFMLRIPSRGVRRTLESEGH